MNRRTPLVSCLLLLAAAAGAAHGAEPAALVARLKHQDATFEDWRPIPIQVVAWNFARILRERTDLNAILTGRELWRHWRKEKQG